MVFQTLEALVGSNTFHGVMTGCLKCQGAHITKRARERGDKERGAWSATERKRERGMDYLGADQQQLATECEIHE